ncbi:unnamed protein product [Owenia fusiformis]|uniref:Uncharacterized protein n=1 Tax=Owenia fusiformis TaxID=6347 RepID=A0A8S4N338_OWEFU|nr:unnamed protein product [Owenia fusiformis]
MASESVTSSSSTAEANASKKSNKPVMEKRRRARINTCLSELKGLLVDFMKQEGSRHSKMEKADILEMTVRYLRQLQRTNLSATVRDPDSVAKYHDGYNECADEVARYLTTIDGIDVHMRGRLLSHLAANVNTQANKPHVVPIMRSRSVQSVLATQSPLLLPKPESFISSSNIEFSPGERSDNPAPSTSGGYSSALDLTMRSSNQEPVHPRMDMDTSNTKTSTDLETTCTFSQTVNATTTFAIPTTLPSASAGQIAILVPSQVIGSGVSIPQYIIPAVGIIPPAQHNATHPNTGHNTSEAKQSFLIAGQVHGGSSLVPLHTNPFEGTSSFVCASSNQYTSPSLIAQQHQPPVLEPSPNPQVDAVDQEQLEEDVWRPWSR